MQTYFVGFAVFLNNPLISWAKDVFRFIPINPGLHLTESLKACSHLLNTKKGLCMFPEGIRSSTGKINDFKRGVGIIVKESRAPVVPVYIQGAFSAWPCHRLLPRPAKITVIFGKKLSAEALMAKQVEGVDIHTNIVANLRNELVKLKASADNR